MIPDETESLLRQIGTRVRSLRRDRGWTRLQLAESAQISPRFLAQLEAGEGNISISRLAHVADALGQPLRRLIPETPIKTKREDRGPGLPCKIVALIGLRGAGKTSVGTRVAEKLKLPFVELDALIEHAALMPLAQIFSLHGESYYRRLELETLKKILQKAQPMILATGGSIVTEPHTWNLVKQNCITVWLKASPEVYWNRLLKQGDTRPMRNNPSAMTELRALLASREPRYRQTDHVVDTSRLTLSQAATAVLRVLKKEQKTKR